MSDKVKDGGNVQKDFGPNVGNIANARAIVGPSGLALVDLNKVEVRDIEIKVPDPWVIVQSFQNGWDNWDTPDHLAKYMKHPDGQVEIRGHIGGGGLTAVAFVLPAEYAPSETIYFACGDGTPNYRSTIAIDNAGQVIPVYGADPWIAVTFLAGDSRPIALSCFPIYIKTKLNPAGVFVIRTDYGENKRSPYIKPGAAANHCDWCLVKRADGNYIQINNLTGLPYNQKTKVRFMIVGE